MNYYWFVGALAVAAVPLTGILTFLLTDNNQRQKGVPGYKLVFYAIYS